MLKLVSSYFVLALTIGGLAADAAEDPDVYRLVYGLKTLVWKGENGVLPKLREGLKDSRITLVHKSEILTYVCHIESAGRDKNCIEIMKVLLEAGADLNHVMRDQYSYQNVLINFAASDCDEIIDFVLSKKPNLEVMDKDGRTPLLKAADLSREKTVRKLLKAGANINAADPNGNTALHYAAKSRQLKLARFLLASGINRNALAKYELSALNYADIQNDTAMIALLRQAGVVEPPLKNKSDIDRREAARNGSSSALSQSTETPSNPNAAKLERLRLQLERKASEIQNVEAEMSAIGWSGPQFYAKTATGYECDTSNQNCRATYQGGGETVASHWRRSDNIRKQRELQIKRDLLIHEYDSLAHKYNAIVQGPGANKRDKKSRK